VKSSKSHRQTQQRRGLVQRIAANVDSRAPGDSLVEVLVYFNQDGRILLIICGIVLAGAHVPGCSLEPVTRGCVGKRHDDKTRGSLGFTHRPDSGSG
jgi:hypothetical protein